MNLARRLAGPMAVLHRWHRPVMVLLPLVALLLTASFAAPRLIASLKGGQVLPILRAIPHGKILIALVLTAASHGLLGVQEVLGLRP